MLGTETQLIQALKPLGQVKKNYNGIKYDCPICLKAGSGIDKFNLEISIKKNMFHCWCCGYSGSIYKIVKERGFKEFLHLFKTFTLIKEEDEEEGKKIFELPKYCLNVLNDKDSTDYLLSRGLTKEKIREREIKFCYAGQFKDGIIFPSYSLEGELTAFIIHFPKQKRYSIRKGPNFVGFYESFIDKKSPIILVEGVYDALVVPNALPMLGTHSITSTLLTFLSNTNVIYIPDTDVKEPLRKQTMKTLKTVCSNTQLYKILPIYKDTNEIFTKNKLALVNSLKQFYI